MFDQTHQCRGTELSGISLFDQTHHKIMLVLSEDDVRASLSVAEAIDINEMAFKASNTCVPDRTLLSFPEHKGVSLFKPATIYDSYASYIIMF